MHEAPSAAQFPSANTHTRLVLLVVGFGTLVTALSGSSVNLALPSLSADLSIGVNLAGWVVTSFLLTVTVLLLVAGRVADLVGLKPVYLLGYLLFSLASLLCGLAGSVGILIVGRVIQGLGGSMIMAAGPALLTTTFPARQRGRALGMVATATYIGLTVGPPLGGWILSISSWRWIFLLNTFSAIVVLSVGGYYLPASLKTKHRTFDWAGTLTLVAGLPLVLFAMTEGRQLGWTSAPIVTAATGGILLLTAFFILERRREHPLLDLRLFQSRLFTGAVVSALGNYLALFVPIILMPFYLIEALHLPPSEAGLILTAQPLLMALVASPAGWLSDRIGSRGLATTGLMVLALGLLGLSSIGQDSSSTSIMLWMGMMGMGTGLFISPNSSALMGSAPRHQQGIASGVMAVARNLGMMMGVAGGTTIYQMAGGVTGREWLASDYFALRVALWAAAGVSLLSAGAAVLRGKTAPAEPGGSSATEKV